jgi:hypothetical protein
MVTLASPRSAAAAMDVLSAASNAACDSDVGHAEETRLSFALIVRYPVAVIGGGGGGKGAAHACVLQFSVFESASLHVPPLDAWVVTVRVHVRVPVPHSAEHAAQLHALVTQFTVVRGRGGEKGGRGERGASHQRRGNEPGARTVKRARVAEERCDGAARRASAPGEGAGEEGEGLAARAAGAPASATSAARAIVLAVAGAMARGCAASRGSAGPALSPRATWTFRERSWSGFVVLAIRSPTWHGGPAL